MFSVRGAVFSITAAALAAGCGSVSNNLPREPAVLTGLQVSDAVTGQMGLMRISFSNPVENDTTVTLASSSTAVATLPASVTVLAGGLSADVQFTAVAAGTSALSATSGMESQTAAVQVVDAILVYPSYTAPMEVGAVTTAGVDINIRVAAPLQVMLTSSNTSIAKVDAMVTIPSFQQFTQAQVTGVAAGNATLTVSADGYLSTNTVTVVEKAQLTQIYTNGVMPPGSSTYAYAYLNAVPRSGGTVTFASTNTAVVMVPPSASPSGNTYVPFAVTAGTSSGTSTISATFNGFTLSTIAYVGDPSSTNFLRFVNLSANQPTLEVGAATLVNASFNPPASTDDSGQIMFSAGGILSTPSTTMVIPANNFGVSFPITGIANGSTNVTVTVDGQQLSVPITIKVPVFSMPSPGTVPRNNTVTIGVNSDALLASDRTFTLNSSAPGVAQVSSASVTAGAGTFGTSFGLKALAPGTSTITATNGSTVLTATITVQ